MGDVGSRGTETWYLLKNGTLLMESADPESTDAFFYQLQCARQVGPDDLRTHDRQSTEFLARFEARWSLVLGLGPGLFLVALVSIGVGFLLAQVETTETVGGWMFWLGIPIAVLARITVKVGTWRLDSGIRTIQNEAGLVPGMIDEIEHARGLELIRDHLVDFTMERITVAS